MNDTGIGRATGGVYAAGEGTQRELKQAQELAQLLTQRMETLENQKAGYRFKLEGRQKKLEQEQAQAEEFRTQAG